MNDFKNVLQYLKDKRERAVSGLYNCLPLPFNRFRNVLPGIEMGKYIICTASQKIGKTKFCDYVFVYETLFFIMEHPGVRAKILYFCLEESPRKKYIEFLSHLLYKLDGIQISPAELGSIDKDYPVPQEILDLLESDKYVKYIKKFEEIVEYIDDTRNPTGINKVCREYALTHGHLNFKTIQVKDPLDNLVDRQIIDPVNPYTPDDPEEYRIIILDNASNIATESGMSKMDSIEKLSKYAITLRDQLNYTFILVQHQAQSKEGIESFKFDKIKPSSDGLADSKKTTRDLNLLIGLYSPFKYGIKEYEGYDISRFRDNIRFMEVLEDRDYGSNGNICPLYFDGVTSTFKELPRADDKVALEKIYKYLDSRKRIRKEGLFMFLKSMFNNFIK